MARSFEARQTDDPRAARFAWWQVALLIAALALAGVGIAVQLGHRASMPDQSQSAVPVDNARGFLSASPASAETTQPGLTAKAAPILTQLGVGFGLAFVVGTMFRTFIKTMAILAAVVIVGLFLVTWFHVADIDWTFLPRAWTRATDYVHANAGEVRTTLATYAASSLAGVAGFVVGFVRK